MELEVSKKVREAIKAKLLELGCHVDDELPDYIMILVANRRSSQEIETDLALFLGENTKKFVSWLTCVLKKLEQVTSEQQGANSSNNNTNNKGKKEKEKPKEKEKGKEEEKKKKEKKGSSKNKNKRKSKDAEEDEEVKVENEKEKEEEEVPKKDKQKELKEPVPMTPSPRKLKLKRNDPKPAVVEEKETAVIPPPSNSKVVVETVKKQVEEEQQEHHDMLILDTGENEFASENIDELRRIALESQAKKRKNKVGKKNEDTSKDKNHNHSQQKEKTHHHRRLITNILMDRVKEDSASPAKPKSVEKEKKKEKEQLKSPIAPSPNLRVLRSPRVQEQNHRSESARQEPSPKVRSSIFSRIGGRKQSKSRSRSRSRSPPIRIRRSRSPVPKLSSRIGSVITRQCDSSDEDSSPTRNRHSLSSVVKVTERPKRDLKLSSKMLLRAVADAQQSIILTEQHTKVKGDDDKERNVEVKSRKRKSDENGLKGESLIVKRSFKDLQEYIPTHLEQPDANNKRRSIKERLGVRREPPRSIKDRLGIQQVELGESEMSVLYDNPYSSYMYDGQQPYSPVQDYKIRVNVNETAAEDSQDGTPRNVMLDDSKRISIQINNSDSSDMDSPESSPVGSPETPPAEKKVEEDKKDESIKNHNDDMDDEGAIQLGVSEEDKLPEVPDVDSDRSEYETYEEILEEETKQSNGEPDTSSCQDASSTRVNASTSSNSNSSDQFLGVTVNKAAQPPSSPKTQLPDLRTTMNQNRVFSPKKPVSPSVNGSPKIKCKYWPQCQFKDKCVYEHPKCKFSPCKNRECIYKHDESSPVKQAKIICKFYPLCTSMNCKFHHPSPCRFGLGCTAAKCENYHPGITIGQQKLQSKGVKILPATNQLKWVKKEG